MKVKCLLACLLSLFLVHCKGQDTLKIDYETVSPIKIQRFDKALFRLIDSGDTTLQEKLMADYPGMLDIIGKGILNMQSPELPGFFPKLRNFYAEPTLKSLYQEVITQYDSIGKIEKDLGYGFAYLREQFPQMQIPAVYVHVSGLNQNVLVGDSLLTLSIDKYMGEHYPLYQDFFYEGQRKKMCPERIVPDYLAGWIMSEYPFEGKENVLLERMIYEGKIRYLVEQASYKIDEKTLMGYTDQDCDWLRQNEGTIWKTIIERKHLYTPDQVTTNQYFEDYPIAFPDSDSPGNIGTWIGWRIVSQYMHETKATPEELMLSTDAQAILTTSKYKPM